MTVRAPVGDHFPEQEFDVPRTQLAPGHADEIGKAASLLADGSREKSGFGEVRMRTKRTIGAAAILGILGAAGLGGCDIVVGIGIYCTEGKDRTGWVSAILQLIAGVDRETVIAEYLISNDRRAEIIDRGVAQARKARGRTAAEITRIRLVVAESYLRAGLDELESRYGDLHGYLTDGLGLDEPTIERLRTRLRTP